MRLLQKELEGVDKPVKTQNDPQLMESFIRKHLDAKLESVNEPDESVVETPAHKPRGTAFYQFNLPEDDTPQ